MIQLELFVTLFTECSTASKLETGQSNSKALFDAGWKVEEFNL